MKTGDCGTAGDPTSANGNGGLIAEVNSTDCKPNPAPDYYEHWLAALEQLLLDKGIMTREEFERRKAEFASGEREEVF